MTHRNSTSQSAGTSTARSTSQSAGQSCFSGMIFQAHLDSYTFPVFHGKDGDTSHRDFVASFAAVPYYTGTRLYLPPNHDRQNDPLVLKALLHKKPVYWGQDKPELTNWDAVQNAFGYNLDDTNGHLTPQQVSETRYAIAGPIRVMAHEPSGTPEHDARAVHVWAPNLESTSTADYETLINRNTTAHRDKLVHDVETIKAAYGQRFRELWHLIIKSATDGLSQDETVWIQSALLGAGCFLKGCPTLLRNDLLEVQFQSLRQVLAEHTKKGTRLHLKLCIYTPDDFPENLVQNYRNLASQVSYFSVGEGRDQGNVLAHLPHSDPSVIPVLVNAGDPLSFIGNGQSKDFTVEGFMVANAGGFNPQARNTSFLHNVRFNSQLLIPESWCVGGD